MTGFQYSIVATTYNDAKSIERYLDDMCRQSLLPKEIVIADGGSTDSTVEKIEQYAQTSLVQIIVISGGRMNISEGYNAAIKASGSIYIGISGIGNRYDREYFRLLAEAFDVNHLDIAYSPIRGVDSTHFARKYNKYILNGKEGIRLQIASNHGAMVKKTVFEELGYFYEKFIYAGEDAEFYWLAKNKGYKMFMVPDAKVYWETPKTKEEFKKQIRLYTIGSLQINAQKEKQIMIYDILKLLIGMMVLFLSVFSVFAAQSLIALTVIIAIVLACICKKRKQLNYFELVRKYLRIYYAIKNRRYMSDEYAVKRG